MNNQQITKDNDFKEEKKNKVLIGDDEIVYMEITKEPLLEEDVWKLLDDLKNALESLGGKAKVLIDIKSSSVIRSSQFRKKTAEIMKKLATDQGYEKAAILTHGILATTIASFLLAASGLKNIRIFNTDKEAVEWFKEH